VQFVANSRAGMPAPV